MQPGAQLDDNRVSAKGLEFQYNELGDVQRNSFSPLAAALHESAQAQEPTPFEYDDGVYLGRLLSSPDEVRLHA